MNDAARSVEAALAGQAIAWREDGVLQDVRVGKCAAEKALGGCVQLIGICANEQKHREPTADS